MCDISLLGTLILVKRITMPLEDSSDDDLLTSSDEEIILVIIQFRATNLTHAQMELRNSKTQ
jgi:hypothetical protein